LKKSVNWSKIALSTNFDIVGKTLAGRWFPFSKIFFFLKSVALLKQCIKVCHKTQFWVPFSLNFLLMTSFTLLILW
jgi:hypothetical protein